MPLRQQASADGSRATLRRGRPRAARAAPRRHASHILFAAALAWGLGLCGRAGAQIELPDGNPQDPISVTAERGYRWDEGNCQVWLLTGRVRVAQGADSATAREAVIWIDRLDAPQGRSKVQAYLEGDVVVDRRGPQRAKLQDQAWFGRFATRGEIAVSPAAVAGPPRDEPPIYRRASAARRGDGAVRQAQFTQAQPALPQATAPPPGTRRIRGFSRGDVDAQYEWRYDEPNKQWVFLFQSGVNLIVDGLPQFGTIDVSTDRMVIWARGEEPDLSGNRPQSDTLPLEIYMEGNVVFRQGDRVLYADRMYYDVTNHVGTVLNAELLTKVPKYEGIMRLKAGVLKQTGRDRFEAQDAYVTPSRFGEPTFRLQSGRATFVDHQSPVLDPASGTPLVDPATQEPLVRHDQLITSENNFVFMDGVPIFYWPYMAADPQDASYYIRRVRFKQDNVFGTQFFTTWNLYQILGMRDRPIGTQWDASVDYLSERGLGYGTNFRYQRDGFLGLPGPATGLVDFWAIYDNGTDNLGYDRRDVPLEEKFRYRLFGQHRQVLPNDFQVSAEIGLISDPNFLEEYFRREWWEMKDPSTRLELRKTLENSSWSLAVDGRVNDFVTQTNWLPRLDHFWIGQPLFGSPLTWFEHSSAAYTQFRTTDLPPPGVIPDFRYLPWEVSPAGTPLSLSGERFVTKHELDLPLELGPVKVVPYVLGEAADWGADRTGNDQQRLYGEAGVRASLPMWAVDPSVHSDLFNVHGLAHKVTFEADFSVAGANRPLTDLPMYDPLDDWSIEAFRRRFFPNTFANTFPPGVLAPLPGFPFGVTGGTGSNPNYRFDERSYALRSGLASWVASSNTEIADDLAVFRLGMLNRWQTKRGGPNNERIIDWVTLDTNVALFPESDRDNFGQVAGLANYDFRWQVGDRLALLSDGIFDFFSEGQKVISVGGFLEHPPRGSLYLGLREFEGPIQSTILVAAYSYRMSPKWISSWATTIDLKDGDNFGQNLLITRVGESFLVTAGFSVDASRGSVGANLSIEPRFLPKGNLGVVGGARVLPAGAMGLE